MSAQYIDLSQRDVTLNCTWIKMSLRERSLITSLSKLTTFKMYLLIFFWKDVLLVEHLSFC